MSSITHVTDRERDLAERLRAAEQKRDELAVLLDKMRSKVCSATICHPNGVQYLLEEALAVTADPASTILRQRDARTLREAAEKLCPSGYDDTSYMGIIRLADALERKNG